MRVDEATQREAVGGWRAERQLVAGAQERELVAGDQERSWWLETGRGVGGWTGEKAVAAGQERGEQQKLAWKNGQGQSTPDTGAERRGSMG